MRKIAVIASASGNGKSTLGRKLARRLDVPFVELDALVHGPRWVETPADELRAKVEPIVASDGWVIDGTYQRMLGDLVLRGADVIAWLDLPIRVWLPRPLRRTARASAATRVRVCTATPEILPSASSHSPVWRPTRTSRPSSFTALTIEQAQRIGQRRPVEGRKEAVAGRVDLLTAEVRS